MSPIDDFNGILISAVDEGLSSLGDSSKQAIFYHLKASFHVSKGSIPTNIRGFKNAIEDIFGPGASFLERIIEARLQKKLGLNLGDKECPDFLTCVENAKKMFVLAEESASQ